MNHLIYFYSAPEPRMTFWENEELKDIELTGKVAADFSFDKKCVGYQNEHGWHKCKYGKSGAKQCFGCLYKDISKVYTRLNFTGYEHIKDEISQQNFSIYLAAFGDSIIKCGVTRTERVETRTMEQGADFFVELMRFDNAEDAYSAENTLQQTFGFKNAVRVDRKMKIALEGRFNDALLRSAIDNVAASDDFSYLLHSKEIRKHHYCTPKKFEITHNVAGEIIASKSSLLFFKKDKKYFCTNMKKKEGCEF